MIIGIPHVSLYRACCHHCSCLTINDFQHIRGTVVDEEMHMELVFRSQHEDESERKADRETQVHDSYLFMALFHQQIVYISRENDRKQNTASQTWYPPFHLDFSLARNRTLSYQNLFIVGSTLFPRTTRYHKCCKDVL